MSSDENLGENFEFSPTNALMNTHQQPLTEKDSIHGMAQGGSQPSEEGEGGKNEPGNHIEPASNSNDNKEL